MGRAAALVLLNLLLLLASARGQVDRTREAGGSGSALVEAVLAELHDACIYPEDGLLLRRIAYVETRDGTDPATYSTPGYDGGIWKVDQAMFRRTQTEHSRLSQQYDIIRNKLAIDWSSVSWADMRKPLYSALAAAMILTLEGAPGNVPPSVDPQADYWLTHYRHAQSPTKQDFIAPVNTLAKTCARTENMDIAFLIDSSSSVGPADWSELKQFVADVIISLSLHNGLGTDKDRVSVLTFSDQARVLFGFDKGVDMMQALFHIQTAATIPGGTNFSAALIAAQTQVFPRARPDAAKVAVVVSDGKDSDRMGMVMSLMPLKLSDVTFFTVGVGSQASEEELKQIASAPTCSHYYHVDSALDLRQLRVAVERISCRVPVVLSPGQYTYPCGFNVLAQVQGGSLGSSITVSTTYGKVEVYGSYTTQLPSSDVNNLHQTANNTTPSAIFTRDNRPLTLNLQSEKTNGLLCNGNYTIRVDSQAAKRTDCNKKKPDLVFLLDANLAHTDADWTAMLNFVQSFTQQFDVSSGGAHVALVSYTDNIQLHFRLGQFNSNAELLQALRTTQRPRGGSSNLSSALQLVHNQVFLSARPDASKTVIILTPGIIPSPQNSVMQTASLHAQGARVIVVGVGSTFDDVTINLLASGEQHVQRVANVNGLASVVANVVKEACGEVSILCVESGITRPCHTEDLVSQYSNILGPDPTVGVNPCAVQIANGGGGVHLERFPHPTEKDKFLLCDSTGQAYVVLCPVGSEYDPLVHECRNPTAGPITTPRTIQTTPAVIPPGVTTGQVTVTPSTPFIYAMTTQRPVIGPVTNPCTTNMVLHGLLFHPYPADPTKYYHCSATPGIGSLETCPIGKVWNQAITQCVFMNVIVDYNTNRVDPNIGNPCTGGAAYFPVPSDPNAFIQCNAHHEGFLKHCHPGEVWLTAQTTCGHPIP